MKNLIFILLFASISFVAISQSSIDGYVYYNLSSNLPISDVTLQLKNTSDNTNVGEPLITNSTGYFKFDNVPDGKYIITCTTTHEVGGINPTDALIVNRNYIRLYNFTDDMKKKAANVNADKYVNPTDALLINRRYIKLLNAFKAGDWLFAQDTITVNGSNVKHYIKGLCYGDVNASFTWSNPIGCGYELVDSRDGQTYRTVKIGNQCWMKENINIGTIINSNSNSTDNSAIEKYCYNDSTKYCDIYGGLYQWDEMMQYVTTEKTQGICPTGWHIPSDREWYTLENFIDPTIVDPNLAGGRGTDICGKVREAGIAHWTSPNTGATNSSGFTALPGGYLEGSFFDGIGVIADIWSSTLNADSEPSPWARLFSKSTNYSARVTLYRNFDRISVRCLKDCPDINAPGLGINVPSQEQVIWKWQAVTGASGYKWSTTNNYNTATDIGTSITYTQNELTCNTSYTLYVWAYNSCGNYSVATLTQNTSSCPCPSVYPPHNGANTSSQDQIIWRWLAVTGASGYKWNSTNDYSTAIDNGIGTSITQSGLICNTSYSIYVWAYNSCDEHSNPSFLFQTTSECPSTFKCGDNLVDTRDSKSYKTVQIGTQCWMKENLNIGTRIVGTTNQSNDGTIEKYCYNDEEANCNVYGGLYQWNEAMQYATTEPIKGICPTGWHIPSEGDWGTLVTLAGGNGVAGGKLKETGVTHWANPNTSATDSYNFTALGAGMRATNGTYWYLTNRTYIWSSGVFDASNAYVRGPLNSTAAITYGSFLKTIGSSVRCIKD